MVDSSHVEKELLTPGRVAELLFVTPKTVTRWAVSGKVSSIRTPGGHRRYLGSEIRALMAGLHPSEAPVTDPAPVLDEDKQAAAAAVVAEAVAVALESVAAEAAETAAATASAVEETARRAAEAAESARGAREFAAQAAARSTARDAQRTATRVRIRADVAAMHVRRAAERTAEDLLHSQRAAVAPDASESAAALIVASRAAADETAEEALRAAEVVAGEVDAAAKHLSQLIATTETALADAVATAAQGVRLEAAATAARVTHQNDARAAGVAFAAREAAAALLAPVPAPRRALATSAEALRTH